MKNFLLILTAVTITAVSGSQSLALAPFKKAWATKYLENHKNEDFQKVAKKASCNVCHIKGAKKNFQNDYGKLINKLIEGDANKRKKEAADSKAEMAKILKEFEAAIDKVAKEKSDGGKGPTYGELIKEGKLPVDLAVAKKKYDEEQKKAK